jgi:hypothetical protein
VYIIMHVPPQPVSSFSVSSIVLLEILIRHIMNGTLAHCVSHTNESFLSTPSICYELLLCVHHYACTTSACTKFERLSIYYFEILTPPYYGRSIGALSVSYTNEFLFLNTSICYELLLCVHHYACTTSACTKL